MDLKSKVEASNWLITSE